MAKCRYFKSVKMELLGRENEQDTIKDGLTSSESKLIAVYGRRRVGKTFMIRQHFQGQMSFEISGLYRGDMTDQLDHWTDTLGQYGHYIPVGTEITTWMSAFGQLKIFIDNLSGKKKKVIFIDELPWFDTPRSKFLTAFESFWNSYCTKRNDLLVIICGSAASWMIQKILKNKGGLHNRVSAQINLQPFNLYETELFLRKKGILWDKYSIIQLYMTTGGIPYYLDAVRKGESVVQFVDRVCFKKDGLLYGEFDELYASLFSNSEIHEQIVATLATVGKGMTRTILVSKSGLSSGGTLTKALEELDKSGFIDKVIPYKGGVNKALYKLTDPFTLFHFKFMVVKGKRVKSSWQTKALSQSWKSWSGFAFERLCFTHTDQIQRALGLQVIQTEISSWQGKSEKENGAQIDMIIDRSDNIINVCEIKFSSGEYSIDKAYAQNLRNKLAKFSEHKANKKKALFLTLITPQGVSTNMYSQELIQSEVKGNQLFKKDTKV